MEVSLNAAHRGLQLSFHVINRVHTALSQAQVQDTTTHKNLINSVCLALASGASIQHQETRQERQRITVPIQLSPSNKDKVVKTIKELHTKLDEYTQEQRQHPEWDTHPVVTEEKRISFEDLVESLYSAWNGDIDTDTKNPQLSRAQLWRYFEGISFLYRCGYP